MSGRFFAILALASLLGVSVEAQSTTVRVDGLAAIVGGRTPGPDVEIILRSDVELRAKLRLAGESTVAVNELTVTGTAAEAVRDELIGEALIVREARRLGVAAPNAAEIETELHRLEDLAGGVARLAELLRDMGARREELVASATRRAQVAAFLKANLASSAAATDAQVERAYESGEHPFVDQPLEEVREDLRIWLRRRAIERAVRRWVEVLQTRTEVRRIGGF